MATKNLVPRGNKEGKIGITDRKWSEAHFVSGSFDSLSVSNIYGNDGTTNLIIADSTSSISVSKNNAAVISADKNLPYGNVIKIMGILQSAKILDIGVAVK